MSGKVELNWNKLVSEAKSELDSEEAKKAQERLLRQGLTESAWREAQRFIDQLGVERMLRQVGEQILKGGEVVNEGVKGRSFNAISYPEWNQWVWDHQPPPCKGDIHALLIKRSDGFFYMDLHHPHLSPEASYTTRVIHRLPIRIEIPTYYYYTDSGYSEQPKKQERITVPGYFSRGFHDLCVVFNSTYTYEQMIAKDSVSNGQQEDQTLIVLPERVGIECSFRIHGEMTEMVPTTDSSKGTFLNRDFEGSFSIDEVRQELITGITSYLAKFNPNKIKLEPDPDKGYFAK